MTLGSRGFHVSLSGIAGAALALVLAFHFLNADGGLAAWLVSAKAEVATHAAWVLRTRQLAQQSAHLRAQARSLADSSDTLRARFTQLASLYRAHLVADSNASPAATTEFLRVTQACTQALDACSARGDSLARADSLDLARALAAEHRVGVADSLLNRGVTLHAQRCGWSIIVGAGGGLVASGTGLAAGIFAGWGCRP